MIGLLLSKLRQISKGDAEKTPQENSQFSSLDMPNDEFDYGHNVPIHRDSFVEDY